MFGDKIKNTIERKIRLNILIWRIYWITSTVFQYIDSDKKLVPYYVMNVAANIPGVTGLFVSGIISAALR